MPFQLGFTKTASALFVLHSTSKRASAFLILYLIATTAAQQSALKSVQSPPPRLLTEAAHQAALGQNTTKSEQTAAHIHKPTMTRIAPIAPSPNGSAFTPPTQSRPPTQLAAGFSKTTKSKDKAVQIKGAPKPMDKQWDNYLPLKDAEGEIREVWLTTPGSEKHSLGFVAARKMEPKEGRLAEEIDMWCAEGHPRLSPFLRGKMKDGQAKLELNLCKVRELSEEEAKKEEEAGDRRRRPAPAARWTRSARSARRRR